jgi:hypothetical protein
MGSGFADLKGKSGPHPLMEGRRERRGRYRGAVCKVRKRVHNLPQARSTAECGREESGYGGGWD